MNAAVTLVGDRWSVGPRHFTHPVRVVTASRLSEVLPALRQAEAEAEAGCWVAGFVSYQAAPAFGSQLRVTPAHQVPVMPLAWFGIYQQSGLASPSVGDFQLGGWTPGLSESDHAARVRAIREAIAAGDTYQVNLTYVGRLRR